MHDVRSLGMYWGGSTHLAPPTDFSILITLHCLLQRCINMLHLAGRIPFRTSGSGTDSADMNILPVMDFEGIPLSIPFLIPICSLHPVSDPT